MQQDCQAKCRFPARVMAGGNLNRSVRRHFFLEPARQPEARFDAEGAIGKLLTIQNFGQIRTSQAHFDAAGGRKKSAAGTVQEFALSVLLGHSF